MIGRLGHIQRMLLPLIEKTVHGARDWVMDASVVDNADHQVTSGTQSLVLVLSEVWSCCMVPDETKPQFGHSHSLLRVWKVKAATT